MIARMSVTPLPSHLRAPVAAVPIAFELSAPDRRRLQHAAAAADVAGVLQPVQQALIHRRGWMRMLAPRAVGGAEMPLPEAVRLEEAIAAADGSCGWVVTLCAGAGWFAGFLPPDLAREILATHRLCVAGSGAPAGVAEREGDGWRLSGHWDFASGAPMATHFTLNALLQADGQPLRDAAGAPRVRAFIVPADRVTVVPRWRSIGLRATATHGFALDAVWVPARQGFDIRPDAATADGPLYRFPFLPLAWVTLAANLSGMAQHFIALAGAHVAQRWPLDGPVPPRPGPHRLLRQARQDLAAAREVFHARLDHAWAGVCAGLPLADADAQALLDASQALVQAARGGVDALYPCCGLEAAHEASALNRVWRDLHTATQHALLTP